MNLEENADLDISTGSTLLALGFIRVCVKLSAKSLWKSYSHVLPYAPNRRFSAFRLKLNSTKTTISCTIIFTHFGHKSNPISIGGGRYHIKVRGQKQGSNL